MEFTREQRERFYRVLSRTRAYEEILVKEYLHKKKMHGSVLQGEWQEAIPVGVALALKDLGILDTSWIGHSHRDQGIFIVKGLEKKLYQNSFLKQDGFTHGHDTTMHVGSRTHRIIPFISHMGASVPVAVGAANALRDLEWFDVAVAERPVAVVFFGDGAAQQGDVHEALNNAAVNKSPIVFVINDNRYAISTRPEEEHGDVDLSLRALGYANIAREVVNGNDVEEVYTRTVGAIFRAQNGIGPTFMLCRTYRGKGHNRTEQASEYMPREEKAQAEQGEPIVFYRKELLRIADFTEEELNAIDMENDREIRAIAEEAFSSYDPVPDRSSVRLFAPHEFTEKKPNVRSSAKMSMRKAINNALENILRDNPGAVLFGEDIADPKGGVLAVTKGLSTKFPGRVFNSPLSEAAIVGEAIGRALAGQRPIAEIQYSPFATAAFTQIVYSAASFYYQKGMNVPLVIRMPRGVAGSGGSGYFHQHCNEGWFAAAYGLKVVFPSDAYEAAGLLYAAFEDPNPVIFFEDIRAYNNLEDFIREVPNEPYIIPLGKANIKLKGSDVTVVVYGAHAVAAAINSAKILADDKISLEIIDLRTLVPLDMDTILESINKTSRLIVMSEASQYFNPPESLAGRIVASSAFFHLRAQPIIVSADNRPVDGNYALEWERLPFEEDEEDKSRLVSHELILAARQAVRY